MSTTREGHLTFDDRDVLVYRKKRKRVKATSWTFVEWEYRNRNCFLFSGVDATLEEAKGRATRYGYTP